MGSSQVNRACESTCRSCALRRAVPAAQPASLLACPASSSSSSAVMAHQHVCCACRYMKMLLVGESGERGTLLRGRVSSLHGAGVPTLGSLLGCGQRMPALLPAWLRRHVCPAFPPNAMLLSMPHPYATRTPGLGKTTFIRNLFAAYARDASFPINDASGPNARRVRVGRDGTGRGACVACCGVHARDAAGSPTGSCQLSLHLCMACLSSLKPCQPSCTFA